MIGTQSGSIQVNFINTKNHRYLIARTAFISLCAAASVYDATYSTIHKLIYCHTSNCGVAILNQISAQGRIFSNLYDQASPQKT